MKKRSLVAAIAMLIVSAIVLTSSTYAWFATNSGATVGQISASVANNDGSLQIKASESAAAGATWKTGLVSTDFTGLPSAFNPVSMAMVSGAPSFYSVNYDGTMFKASGSDTASVNVDYMKYGFDVQYINASADQPNIRITPTWSDTSDFCYALVKVASGSTTTFYMFQSAGSYVPVTGLNGDITDTKGSGASVDIIDSADVGFANAATGNYASVTSINSGDNIDIQALASDTTSIDVDVYIWAEGQDAQCSGTTASGSATLSFALSVVPVTAQP